MKIEIEIDDMDWGSNHEGRNLAVQELEAWWAGLSDRTKLAIAANQEVAARLEDSDFDECNPWLEMLDLAQLRIQRKHAGCFICGCNLFLEARIKG